MSEPLLTEPLADALDAYDIHHPDLEDGTWMNPDAVAAFVLETLRANPVTFVAMTEALWDVLGWTNQPDHRPSGLLQCDNDNPEWERVTERILDALLGPAPAPTE